MNKLLAVLTLLVIPAFAAEEIGTVGLRVMQLYNDAQPNKRGVLMVWRVEPGSAAADAGVRVGDIVFSVNGSAIAGRDPGEILQKEFKGSIGGAVRLGISKPDVGESQIVLTRKPFPPHINPASDPFSYVIPGSWQMDLRYKFPLPWSPAIPYQGFEDLAFAPNFDDANSAEYHSYLIFWWLERTKPLTAEELGTEIAVYFRGLAEQRGRNNHFVPDLSKVSAEYREATEEPATFSGMPAKVFRGDAAIYDRRGNVIKLHSEATAAVCPATDRTVVFFGMSLQPRPADIWSTLDSVRDSFRCNRN